MSNLLRSPFWRAQRQGQGFVPFPFRSRTGEWNPGLGNFVRPAKELDHYSWSQADAGGADSHKYLLRICNTPPPQETLIALQSRQ